MGRVLINVAFGLYCFWNAFSFASMSPMPAKGSIFGIAVPGIAYLAFWVLIGVWCLYTAYKGRQAIKG